MKKVLKEIFGAGGASLRQPPARHLGACALRLLLLCVALVAAGGCGGGARADGEITVSAAASLRDAFQEIGRLYESRTGFRVSFNFGASGALQRQIEAGAPVDVFASAGGQQMNALDERNLVERETRVNFARNELVVVTPREGAPALYSFAGLDSPAVRRVAVGAPSSVPAGQYAAQVFERTGLAERLKAKLVTAEDVRQVLDYVARGEADAGVVYRTDARGAGDRARVAAVAPEGSHDPILYPIAVVRESRSPEAARAFVGLVAGPEGQAVLRRHGFLEAGAR